jgi:hypothetical protein
MWVLLFPLVAPLAITQGRRDPVWRLAAGIAVFVVSAPFWVAAFTSGGSSTERQTAEAPVETPAQEADAPEEAPPEPDTDTDDAEAAASEQEADSNGQLETGGGTESSTPPNSNRLPPRLRRTLRKPERHQPLRRLTVYWWRHSSPNSPSLQINLPATTVTISRTGSPEVVAQLATKFCAAKAPSWKQ